ncbi:MAG: TAXI family TRAP transporter solute-binding subunit [Betaproteobacteria bacterium]|nr:TAXI family TRAP transporter solute-binding subunit [Betaproteobacteria bacterium]
MTNDGLSLPGFTRRKLFNALATVGLLATSPSLLAQNLKLPATITVTAYDTGSSGFNMGVAIGKMLKDKQGSDVRVLPAGNDVARLAPLKANRAQASFMGVGAYFAQEGVLEFATKEWGPQALRLMLSSTSCNAISLGVAKDTGVKEVKDLRGKRIGVVVGSPALNQNAFAVLAFGNLTPKDVKLVEFSSYGAMWKGIINNEVDAAIASTISGQAKEAEASPRGLVYPQTPASDKEGWARLKKVSPYYGSHTATCGPGISPQNPSSLPSYPYPIVMAYAAQSAEIVYGITKSMIIHYDVYKDTTPGIDGFELKRQDLTWALPYHDGAVKAIKESGAWTADAEAHQQAVVKRQQVLQATWNDFMKTNPPEDKEAFRKAWMSARAAGLRKANLDVIFE